MFEELIGRVDAANARIGTTQLELLRLIADVDRCGAWEDEGARDVAHWLGMRYGISEWKARRWVVAAHALDGLPRLSRALADGTLGIDKVVELARFATPESEARLLAWAQKVSCGAVRRRGDLETKRLRRTRPRSSAAVGCSGGTSTRAAGSASRVSFRRRRARSSRRRWSARPS